MRKKKGRWGGGGGGIILYSGTMFQRQYIVHISSVSDKILEILGLNSEYYLDFI